jgi:MoaA/NifB/PqqE/SkfB family radical SAM enzyme
MIKKNRDRENYTFANINLLGKCNADCYFCLGKDISQDLAGKDQLKLHFMKWKNFMPFLHLCKKHGIRNLYLTGQTADGLQYKYLGELVDFLQGSWFRVGVRTNGYLAKRNIATIRKMDGEIGYSLHSLNPETNKIIMGRSDLPDWDCLLSKSGKRVRVSIVLNRYNVGEIFAIVKYVSGFRNVKYIQVRRISTDTRLGKLYEDIEMFEHFYKAFSTAYEKIDDFSLAPEYELYGKKICFWRTVETSCNSLNYFTDGTISDEYFIVEGYLKNKQK